MVLYPRAAPTLSLVESVRATMTAEALGLATQPTATTVPTPTPQPAATVTPYPSLEPTVTFTLQPTVESAATTTPMPPTSEPTATNTHLPTATNTPVPTATNTPVPIPTSTPEPPPAPPASTTLTRGPYLQSVTSDSIIIAWETSAEVDSVVEYGRTPAYGSTASDYTWTTRHAVTLTGLSPHSVYHYRVGTSAQVLSDNSAFKTAAGPGQTSFTFMVISDTHSGLYDFPRRQRQTDQNHRALVDRMLAVAPDFYLHLGDFVEEGTDLAAWNDFFAIEWLLMKSVTLVPTLGNHERNHHNYFDLFYLPNNERWYSFDYGNAHFICLEIDGYTDISPGSQQYQWFENDLAGTGKTWKFVFFHFPAYSSGPYGPNPDVQASLVPLFQQYGVDMVINGHEHYYQRNIVDGITYLVAGPAGIARPTGYAPGTQYAEETPNVVKISVTGNALSGVGMRPDGSEFDPFTLASD